MDIDTGDFELKDDSAVLRVLGIEADENVDVNTLAKNIGKLTLRIEELKVRPCRFTLSSSAYPMPPDQPV